MQEAYVVVHGFGGNPKDVENIRKELINLGMDFKNIYLPLLKGHHREKRGIDFKVTYIDMILGLKKDIKDIRKHHSKVYVIGYSMGALISMEVATQIGVDKLILLNAPVRVWHFRNFMHTLKTSRMDRKKYHIKTVLSSVTYRKILNKIELGKLQKNIKKNMNRITADTLIIQSKYDYVARPSSSAVIYGKISSKNKKIIEYIEPSHFIPSEENLPEIVKDIYNWIYNSNE